MGQPAARIGDMHVCPMVTPAPVPVPHVGGPILPIGVPTVLIGGLPAAVVGNMCTCVGPPDVIVKGSLGVFIGGMPAARMGDMTAHGGTIVIGCITVLIGDINPAPVGAIVAIKKPCAIIEELKKDPTTEEEKQKQVQLQKELDNSVKANLSSVPPDQRGEVLKTAQHYQKTSDALDVAKLSEAAYGPDPKKDPIEEKERIRLLELGHKKLDEPARIDKFGLTDKEMVDNKSGFKSAIYESTTGKEPKYIAAFAGTENGTDWKTNFKQGVGMQDDQYDSAINIGKKMRTAVGPEGFQTTGHSLGGGLASAASAVSGAKGTTFDAAGLHKNTTERIGLPSSERNMNQQNVDSYQNSHDPLSAVQNNREGVIGGLAGLAGGAGALVGSPLGPSGSAAGAGLFSGSVLGLGADGALPRAYGNKIEVPPDISMLDRIKRDGLGAVMSGHDMKEMRNLLDKQTKDDLEKLKKQFGCP